MKKSQKILAAFALVLSLSLFAGCQMFSSQSQQPTDIDNVPRDRRIGVIQSLGGVKTSSQGTHLLALDDGSTILLKSLMINLDDQKYASQKVEVSGVLTYTTDKQQVMEVEAIDVLESAPTQQIQTVTWRDYVNVPLGFKVKYRDDFKLQEGPQMVIFSRPVSTAALLNPSSTSQATQQSSTMEAVSEHTISVEVLPHHGTVPLVTDLLKLKDDSSATLAAAGFSKIKIGIDSLDGYKKVSADGKQVDFYADSDGKYYHLTFRGGNDGQFLEDQNVFYDFLGSFDISNITLSDTQQQIKSVPATLPDTQESAAQKILGAPTSTTQSKTSLPVQSTQATLPVPSTKGPHPSLVPVPVPVPVPVTQEQKTAPVGPKAPTPGVPPLSPTGTLPTPSTSGAVTTSTTLLPGYTLFNSSGYKFTMQFPKNWYYGQSFNTAADANRTYSFGAKPVDTTPGDVSVDIVSGGSLSGTPVTLNGVTVNKVTSGDQVSFSVMGKNGRVYRITGPSSVETSLGNMASTIVEQ